MGLSVRVPGKVLLCGEYAVLRGGTAVLAPVSRALTVAEARTGTEAQALSPVVREALAEPLPFSEPSPPLRVTVDRGAFFHAAGGGPPVKLGLGSSAAEAVGVIALRFQRAGRHRRSSRREVFRHALAAHRRAQGGRGSGADVAACAFGTWIRYRPRDPEPEVVPIPAASRPPLPLSLLWTGRPADTRQAIDRFETWERSGGRAVREKVERLVRLADRTAGLWSRRDVRPEDLTAALRDYAAAVDEIAREAGFPYLTPEIRRLDEEARAAGGLAKPTGAGGGDLALLVRPAPR